MLGLRHRQSWRCLIGAAGLVVVATPELPDSVVDAGLRGLVIFDLSLFAMLVIGAVFADRFARMVRFIGSALVSLVCVVSVLIPLHLFPSESDWVVVSHALTLAGLLAAYGWLLRYRPSLTMAGLAATAWLAAAGWRGYWWLRQLILGLDYLVLSLIVLALAVVISLSKGGVLARRLFGRVAKADQG
jgi:hypothetical protein